MRSICMCSHCQCIKHSNAYAMMLCTSDCHTGNGVCSIMHHPLVISMLLFPYRLSNLYVQSDEAMSGDLECVAYYHQLMICKSKGHSDQPHVCSKC